MRWEINIIKIGKYPISQEARLVSLIAQWIVNDRRLPEIEKILAQESVNWEYFNSLLAQHELSSFAYSCLKNYSALLPSGEVDLLKKTYYFVLAYLAGLEKEFLEIADIFREQGVDLLPLKGSAFLIDNMYNGKTGLRPMVDIDILIKKQKISQAENLLETLGYQKELCGFKEDYWRRKNYHIAFAKNKSGKMFSILELHWLLDYPGKLWLLPSLWERIRKLQVGKREVALLSPEDTLFCLTLHLRRFGNVLSLKSACDFACLLTKYKDLDWDYILKEAKNGQMCASLYFRLIQANIFFDIQVPNLILNSLTPVNYKKRLIEGFILKDTFLGQDLTGRNIFLKNHFLVYDNFWEPVSMIIKMPQEQFAKFYKLSPYSIKTHLWYRLRFLYFPYYLLVLILKATIRKIVKSKNEYAGYR
ncbi:MAG: nucleotidyltransferase family protein [Candidatus Omnitrophota bacterium]|nr:nucleotidyltransferase family protein [Candidatus Omnitrophota bacterium]